jgi:flavorubredoxin
MNIEEIAADVFALSIFVPVKNRSWLPPEARGFEPFNIYLALNPESALLIDTGPPAHREQILGALRKLIGARRLIVMVTRSELECIGNIGAVVDRYPVSKVLGIMKNLPILGLVHFAVKSPSDVEAGRVGVGRTLAEFGFARFRPVEPVIKTLSTIWMIDELDDVLFTSDFFCADLASDESESLLRKDMAGVPSREFIRRRLIAKFDWLARADTERFAAAWRLFFAHLRPRVIAPGLGRLQYGSELAARAITDYGVAAFGDQLDAA